LQWRALLPAPPHKAKRFLHLRRTYRTLHALQAKTTTKQLAFISLEPSTRGIVARTQLSVTAFGGFAASLPLPNTQARVSQNASRKREQRKTLQNHLFIPSSRMRRGTGLEEKPSLPAAHHPSQGCLEKQHQTSADTSNYIQIADTRSVIDPFLEGRTSYPVKRGVTLLNPERIITQRRGHSCYWYTSGFVSEPDREQRSPERFSIQRQA